MSNNGRSEEFSTQGELRQEGGLTSVSIHRDNKEKKLHKAKKSLQIHKLTNSGNFRGGML